MTSKILITGGSGLVGRRLTKHLLKAGHKVNWLTRSGKSMPGVKSYPWNVDKNDCDPKALEGVEAIVHLAGEGVAQKRWTPAQKQKILTSRTQSTRLLHNVLKKQKHNVQTFISASAIGYYGSDNGNHWLTENSAKGNDFLADVVDQWESTVDEITSLGLRTVKLRIGVVLSSHGGALEKMLRPIKWGVGAPLGSGKQYVSWIHIDDLCRLFMHCLANDEAKDVYNAVAPNPVMNTQLTKALAKAVHRKIALSKIPAFILKLTLGERANLVLGGARVKTIKLPGIDFSFHYEHIVDALENLYQKG